MTKCAGLHLVARKLQPPITFFFPICEGELKKPWVKYRLCMQLLGDSSKTADGDKAGNHSPEGVIIEPKTNDGIGIQEWVICSPPLGYMRTHLTGACSFTNMSETVLSASRIGSKGELQVHICDKWIEKQQNGWRKRKWIIMNADSDHLWTLTGLITGAAGELTRRDAHCSQAG